MELFPRSEPLERVGDAGEACAPSHAPHASHAPHSHAPHSHAPHSHAPHSHAPWRARPWARGAVHESLPDRPRALGDGARTSIVVLASLGAHIAFAGALALVPATSSTLAATPIEIEMSFPVEVPRSAPPEIVPEVLPEPEVLPTPEPVRVARAERPRAIAPAPEPEPETTPAPAPAAPGSAPPSLDEVFGDPAPPLETMGAAGGGFAIAAGAPGGRAGGVPGGTGSGVGGSVGGAGVAAATGPSTADIRRARRAYADRIEALLRQHARYPIAARAQRLGGRVALALRIADDGRLLAARVVGSCGYAMLDAAALETVSGIASFPRPPTLVPWDSREELRTSLVYQVTR